MYDTVKKNKKRLLFLLNKKKNNFVPCRISLADAVQNPTHGYTFFVAACATRLLPRTYRTTVAFLASTPPRRSQETSQSLCLCVVERAVRYSAGKAVVLFGRWNRTTSKHRLLNRCVTGTFFTDNAGPKLSVKI